jgi:hypothetical protein
MASLTDIMIAYLTVEEKRFVQVRKGIEYRCIKKILHVFYNFKKNDADKSLQVLFSCDFQNGAIFNKKEGTKCMRLEPRI